jgi:hypothetical protein
VNTDSVICRPLGHMFCVCVFVCVCGGGGGKQHHGPLGLVHCSCAATVQTVPTELKPYDLAVVRYKIRLVCFLNPRDYCLKGQLTPSPILRTTSGYPPTGASYPIDEPRFITYGEWK